MKQSAISSIHQDSGSLTAVSTRVQGKWWAFSHRQEATNKGETNIMLHTISPQKKKKKRKRNHKGQCSGLQSFEGSLLSFLIISFFLFQVSKCLFFYKISMRPSKNYSLTWQNTNLAMLCKKSSLHIVLICTGL